VPPERSLVEGCGAFNDRDDRVGAGCGAKNPKLIGASRGATPGAIEQSSSVAPRVAVAILREAEVTLGPLADERTGSSSAMNARSLVFGTLQFVFGTLRIVAEGRDHAEARVEYSADRDMVRSCWNFTIRAILECA